MGYRRAKKPESWDGLVRKMLGKVDNVLTMHMFFYTIQ